MTSDITMNCPTCGAVEVTVERNETILVAGCGCMLTPLQVRQHTGASKKEVATL